MNSMKRISGLFSLCFALLFVWSGVASAGVPAPVPGGDAGPQRAKHQIANLGDFQFESGEVVKDFKVSYVTHGKLNESKDNVILVMHHAFGDHNQLGFLIGPGKALDTNKYFIVTTDMLGNANLRQDITSGPTNSGLKMEFPRYTFRDSVTVEYRLLKEHLGLDHILAAIGASVGGMKAYQFGVSYPTYVKGLIPIAGTPVTNPQMRSVLRNWMDILELDSAWYGGNYETNPIIAYNTMVWNLLPLAFTYEWFATNLKTEDAYRQWKKMWRDYLQRLSMDVRDVYYILNAWKNFNIGETPGFNGDAKAALQSIQAQVLIIGNKSDMFFNREESIFAQSVIPKATYLEIDTPWGHLTCLGLDPEGTKIMDRVITKFLSNLVAGGK